MPALFKSVAIAALLLGGCKQTPSGENTESDALMLKVNGDELANAKRELRAGTPHKGALDCIAAMANLEHLRALDNKEGPALAGEIEEFCGLQLPLAIVRPRVLAAEKERTDRPNAEFYAECMNPHYKMVSLPQ